MHAVTEPEQPESPPPPTSEDPPAAADAPAPAEAASPSPTDEPGLSPAQPEPEELRSRPVYMPKIPWLAVLAVVATIGGGYSMFQAREAQHADELRRQLLTTQQTQLADVSTRYQAFRARLERWTMEAAAAGEPEQHVDPRLRIAGLHDGQGLYLRIHASDAASAESIARGALSMEQDAITRCLGIAPSSARGLYERGDFLMPEWTEQLEAERDYLRLRVMDEQLARHITADVPVVATMMQAQYFLLVLQQGENRRDAPVDVYLWDMASETQLLAARVQADGVLLPVRIRTVLPDAPEAPRPEHAPSMTSGGAHDCSIASQIKALTGEAPVAVSAPIGLGEEGEAAPSTPSEPAAPSESAAPSEPAAPSGGEAPSAAP